jgi:hypothetical protein
MSEPYWAPQNLQQSAFAGRDAATIGGDLNNTVNNNYSAALHDGVSMSYDTFKKALKSELDEQWQQLASEHRQIQQQYEKALGDAYADYKNATVQRNQLQVENDLLRTAVEDLERASLEIERLRAENVNLRSRGVAIRASWMYTAGIIVAALILGGFISHGLFDDSEQTSKGASEPTPPSVTSLPTPEYSTMDCGQGGFLVQLEAVGSDLPGQALRALVLQQELYSRMNNVGLGGQILVTRAADYCLGNRPDVENYVFLWLGPFRSRDEAEAACARFRSSAVSEDCYAASIG